MIDLSMFYCAVETGMKSLGEKTPDLYQEVKKNNSRHSWPARHETGQLQYKQEQGADTVLNCSRIH